MSIVQHTLGVTLNTSLLPPCAPFFRVVIQLRGHGYRRPGPEDFHPALPSQYVVAAYISYMESARTCVWVVFLSCCGLRRSLTFSCCTVCGAQRRPTRRPEGFLSDVALAVCYRSGHQLHGKPPDRCAGTGLVELWWLAAH